jgi:hypothetical protein
MLAARRRARYGYLLALHILLLCAAGYSPTAIAAVLFCSRSRVSRTVRAYRDGPLGLEHDTQGRLVPPVRTTALLPTLRRHSKLRLSLCPVLCAFRRRGTSRRMMLTPAHPHTARFTPHSRLYKSPERSSGPLPCGARPDRMLNAQLPQDLLL